MKFNELEKVWTSNKSPCYLGLTLFPPFLFHCVKLRLLLLLLSAASTTKKIGLRSDGSRSCAIRNTTTSECVCVQDESLLVYSPFLAGKRRMSTLYGQTPPKTQANHIPTQPPQCTQYHTRLPSTSQTHQQTLCSSCFTLALICNSKCLVKLSMYRETQTRDHQ